MQFKSVPLGMLSEGFVLASAIHDPEHRLLLGAGVSITQELVVGLYKRGVRNVVVTETDFLRLSAFSAKGKARSALPHHPQARPTIQCESSRELDGLLNEPGTCDLKPSENPFAAKLEPKGTARYDRGQMDRVIEHQQKSVNQVKDLFGQLKKGATVASDALHKISHECLVQAAEDMDLFVSMGINPIGNDSIFSHSTNVATLAIAIGATLGLDEKMLGDLGTGCLIHDAGMLHIDRALFESARVLGAHEFVEIAKHPIISTDLLYKQMERVPNAVRMIAYQMHERCDGSGYPRGTTAERIHPLAKIASVADAYVALVSPRPHRSAMLPYFAVTKILQDVSAGLFDPTIVRALLKTISLFPIGSFVELSDGRIAKSVRANGANYDRPVLETWQKGCISQLPEVVNLNEADNLRVVKPLSGLE